MSGDDGARALIDALRRWRADARGRVVVAIDGHGASGKTTLAEAVARATGAEVIHTDDFLRAGDPAGVPAGSPAEAPAHAPRPMDAHYDWGALRLAVTRALRAGTAAGAGADTPLLVEGVSAGAPALADLITHSVFVATPEPVRLTRLHARISAAEWDEQWLADERAYFATRPPTSFDLVVDGAGSGRLSD